MSHAVCIICYRAWETLGDNDLCLDGNHLREIDWIKRYKETEECIKTMENIPGHHQTSRENIMTEECRILLARVYELERKLNGK